MHGLVLCVLSCLAGTAAGYDDDGVHADPNGFPEAPKFEGDGMLESPGLEKCMDLALEDMGGRRETIDELRTKGAINVQLFACHGEFNQQFRMVKDDEWENRGLAGKIVSKVLPDRCLEAEDLDVDGSNVHFAPCEDDKAEQKWVYLDGFYIEGVRGGVLQVADGKMCLDVKAERSADGGREIWSEIKAHYVNNVQLYKCHDLKSLRVNQLWRWNMIEHIDSRRNNYNNNGGMQSPWWGTTRSDYVPPQRKFSLHDLGLKATAPVSLALTMVAISLFAAGVAIGTYRARRVNAFTVPLEPTESE